MSSDKEDPPSGDELLQQEEQERSNVQNYSSEPPPSIKSNPRRQSKIVTPSQRRVANGGPRTPQSNGKMGMYERSMLHLAARERNLERTKQEIMQECTFTPETNKSRSSSHSGNSSSRRLPVSKRTTPKKTNTTSEPPKSRSSPTSVSSSGSTRIDRLYQDGLRRARNRTLTDKQEAEARRRRLEEEELAHCTFRPNMDWRKKKSSRGGKTNGSSKKCTPRSHTPPVDVITTEDALAQNIGKHSIVSPLRGPEIRSGVDSVGDDTEYGSI